MALYIRDAAVDELARQLSKVLNISKTDAVRLALESHLGALNKRKSLAQRVAGIQSAARAAGLSGRPFDDKSLMDELSGGL